MSFWWGLNEFSCSECLVSFRGPKTGSLCPNCIQDSGLSAYKAPEGIFGNKTGQRRRGRSKDPRETAESDLRWFWMDAAGELGLRAINMDSDMIAPTLNYASQKKNERGEVTEGVWKVKTSRTVVVRGMSVGQMFAANRARKVLSNLARIKPRSVRVLQRRYEQSENTCRCSYLSDLYGIFSEWGPIIDYMYSGMGNRCKPKAGSQPSESEVTHLIGRAKSAYESSLVEYIQASSRPW